MPMLLWANLGTTALVLVASIDLRLLGLFLIGIAGTWLYLDRNATDGRRMLLEAVFALALLFLGIGLMHTAGEALEKVTLLHSALQKVTTQSWQVAASSGLLSLAMGTIGAIIVQSSSGITVLAMAATQSGLLNENSAVMVVLGATLGSGVVSLILAPRTQGMQRQIAVHQGLTKSAAAALLVAVVGIEQTSGYVLLEHLVDRLTDDISSRLAIVYLVANTLPLAAHHLGQGPLEVLLNKMVPDARGQNFARPRFISDAAADDPDIGLLLAGQEQQRLAERLIQHLPIDATPASGPAVAPDQLAGVAGLLSVEIGDFLGRLAGGQLTSSQVGQLTNLQSRNETLRSLHETLGELRTALMAARRRPGSEPLATALAEGLGALLMCVDDAARSGEAEDIDLLLLLSADRGDVVDGMRRRVMATSGADAATQEAVYAITSLFERTVWLVQRYGSLLQQATR